MRQGADSLFEMARRACGRYSARITDIGDLDYDLIRPVLLKIESPEKLHQLEQASPQIIGRDSEIWLSFIKRDIPDWQLKRHEPSDPKNWYKVYRKLKKEAQESSTADEAMLKAALANISKQKEQNVTQMTTRDTGPAQGPSRRAKVYHNYISGKTGSKGANKMTLMEKIRKEARGPGSSQMSRPMHELRKRATMVTKAPTQFVEDLKRRPSTSTTQLSSPPKPPVPTSRPTSKPPLHAPRPGRPPPDTGYDLTSDREARLKALKSSREPVTGSAPANGLFTADFLEDSDLEDEQDDHRETRAAVTPKSTFLSAIGDLDRPPRSSSPMKVKPQPVTTLKRKHNASMFIQPTKRIARDGGGPS